MLPFSPLTNHHSDFKPFFCATAVFWEQLQRELDVVPDLVMSGALQHIDHLHVDWTRFCFRISLKRGSCQIVSNLDPTSLPGTTGRTSPWWTISREQWKPSAPWAKIEGLFAQLRWLILFKKQDKQKFQTFCFQIKVVSFSDRLFGRWILFVLPRLSSELHWTR